MGSRVRVPYAPLFPKRFAAMLVQAEYRRVYSYVEAKPNFAALWKKVAAIAQLVEHNLAKVRVASSSLVSRSKREH